MTVAQGWSIIGVMATSLAALVAVIFRIAGVHNKTMTSSIDGLRNEFNAALTGFRGEVRASFEGLRNEMVARFDHLDVRLAKVESIDREVHTLAIKVFGEDPPRSD